MSFPLIAPEAVAVFGKLLLCVSSARRPVQGGLCVRYGSFVLRAPLRAHVGRLPTFKLGVAWTLVTGADQPLE